jgi:hypothetical protein
MPPGAGPSVPLAYYNTGVTSGMASGTTFSSTLSTGTGSPSSIQAGIAGGNAHITVAGLVATSLAVILLFHLLGFRFAFDADVGRR